MNDEKHTRHAHDEHSGLRLLRQKTCELTDAALDIAAAHVAEFPEDVEAVERARAYLRACFAGHSPEDAPREDLLFVLGTLIDVFDIDCGRAGVGDAIELEIEELLAGAFATRPPRPRFWSEPHGCGGQVGGCGHAPRPYRAPVLCPCCGLDAIPVFITY